ncbi:uncharacterized protein B0P05DRAFT_65100 [Gilbertella persicaria]|uniref:uncharacterized protein n=1 Tax=Gilbertella persicaria TaxID=101096 RepID=UPI00221E811D|nr:uncharacterized protein B0P05DRAFT_65100 [Gilbertella persicaria]KAI8081884.1 hypothetical protein B0P05DRAFT_65100 [Gilbertella persicaria]
MYKLAVQDKTNEFINMKVKKRPNDHIKANKLCIPFSIPIPPDLNGTFVSKKGSIEYYLQSELLLSEPIIKKQNVFVYANMKLKSLRESAIFYSSLLEADRQVLRSTYGHVSVDLSMPRTLWISGTPIYLSFKLHNYTLFDTVSDIKLQLVCKQDVMDNDTICNIVSHTSLASLGWWRPLEPNSKDHVTMTIDVPPNLFTIQNQALIQVSFSVHVSIYSLQNSDVIADIPVTIAHPISMDPPPGNYTKTKTSQMPLFPQNNFQKQQQATKILEETSSVSSMDSIIHTRGVSSVTSISDNLKDQASSISSNSTKFHTIKKNLIHWGSLHIENFIALVRCFFFRLS